MAGFAASRLTSRPGALNCRLFSSGLDLVEKPSVRERPAVTVRRRDALPGAIGV